MASMDVQMEAAEARKAVRSMHGSPRIAAPPQLSHCSIGVCCNFCITVGTVRLNTEVMSCRLLQQRRRRRRPVYVSGNGQLLRRLDAAPRRTPHAAPLGCSSWRAALKSCCQTL